jgi:GDP-4-dehydro-6-deoxy-D-mannose reductase
MIGRILVTGASGFAGRHLLPALRQRFPDADLLVDRFDIGDASAAEAAVRGAAPDACVHLAGVTAVPAAARDPDTAWRVNLHGTLHLARGILKYAPACRLLHVSTGEVYGRSFRAGVPLTEAAPLAPMNDYAATKAAADLAVGAMVATGLRVVVARPFNHTGPGQTDRFVVAAFARQVALIAAGQQPPVLRVGAVEPRRDFIDVRDVVDAYVACLAHDLEPGTILNLASGTPRRVGDILRDLCREADVEATIEVDRERLRPGDIPLAQGDASLARASLNWEPSVPWSVTLRDVLEDWRGRVAAGAA